MSDAWQEFPGAPDPGTRICALGDIAGNSQGFDLDGFPLIIVRSADGLRAYVNACPHQFLPLDWRSDKIVSGDGKLLRCSNHDAGFDACTGQGVDGFGAGCALDPIPLHVTDDNIFIAEDPA